MIKSKVGIAWDRVPSLILDPARIPPEVTVKGVSWSGDTGRPTLFGPGRTDRVTLDAWRSTHRLQKLAFDMACALTRELVQSPACQVPAQALFPQILKLVERSWRRRIECYPTTDRLDVFMNPLLRLGNGDLA